MDRITTKDMQMKPVLQTYPYLLTVAGLRRGSLQTEYIERAMGNEQCNIKTSPGIFGLEPIQRSCSDAEGYSLRAVHHHELESPTVSFRSSRREPGHKNGAPVSIRPLPDMISIQGALQVAGLTLPNYPAKQFPPKPFKAAPRAWSVDRL